MSLRGLTAVVADLGTRPNTCNTIIEKTSSKLHLFYFYPYCILIGLNLDKSTHMKRQLIFDFTGFNYLKQPNLQIIVP